ncbi:MAG: 5-formyltetrahydrofolate cyclo-ligase [Oscillospiraceae bacterium]|nr:5-formyltetrahydrofolate cyclo-ligase [Oscillospiraceae bacterium]
MDATPLKDHKAKLREILHDEIAALPDGYIADSNRGIYLQAVSLKRFADARNIMVYYSVRREPDTIRIINAALSAGKTVALPYCLRGGILQARLVCNLIELKPAVLGIPAPMDTAPIMPPDELDLVIVPALTYDRTGNRIGYGGGYYDRFLKDIPAYTVGLARERLIRDKLPIEPRDVAVKCVITETDIIMDCHSQV